MKNLITTRRNLLAAGAAVGALGVMPSMAWAQSGNTLRLRLDRDLSVLDPGFMIGAGDVEAQKQCLPFLAEYVRDGDTFSWQPSMYVDKLELRDPTHIDFELKEGLVWSNDYGPVTAADVKYSYERMKTSDWSSFFDVLDRVDVTGERTGTIVLSKPFAPFIMVTLCHGTGSILSEKAMADVGGRFTNEFPAVAGPYDFRMVPGQRAEFTRNPNWTGPQPPFERIEANVITEVKAGELAFEAGELDCVEIGADTLARYNETMPDNAAITVAGELQYMWMGMNTENPKLSDIRVRQAIQHAVDVDSILAGAYSGTTAKSNGIICPGLLGQRESTSYSYDPQKAQELLSEAGVSGLQLTLRTLNQQERMLAAQIIQANLGAIGIQVTVLPTDAGPFWEMGKEDSGDGWKEIELWLMRFGTQPDPYEATSWFVSSQVGVWNWERWKSEEYDRLYEEGLAESDPERRRQIYVRMQEIMEETGAYVWINHEPEVFAHRDSLTINAAPSGELNYRRFEEV